MILMGQWKNFSMMINTSFGLPACPSQSNFALKFNFVMSNFKIVPLTENFCNRIRQTMRDDYGNQLFATVAAGAGPCRQSLKPFKVGADRRILVSHTPFESNNTYHQVGPIFIHAEPVETYSDIYRFPPEIKADKESFPLSILGYSSDDRMVYTELVGDKDIDERLEAVFNEHPEAAYLHVRNSEACCFICKVERR